MIHDRDGISQWHSIRPWRPTLSLSVREITSVSATFILSSPLAAAHSNSDQENDNYADNDGFPSAGSLPESSNQPTQIISEVLSKGLSVKVNGTPWQRVLMKVDEVTDEAVIILFGLMPARQYDIELGTVPGDPTLRGKFTTDSHQSGVDAQGNTEPSIDVPLPEPVTQSRSTSSNASSHHNAPPLASTRSHSPVNASTPPPTISIEDHRIQLTHKLDVLNNEHATLTTSLKSARREAQKADAALRSEIDTLKRASEKHVQQEARAKQKVLALQEAVRRTVAATEDIKAMIKEVEEMLPELEKRRREAETEWQKVSKQAESIRSKREDAESKEKRKTEGLQAEAASLGNRMERLNIRREKLEGENGVIGELEEKLRRLEEERTRIENDPLGYIYDEDQVEDIPEVEASDSRLEDSPSSDNVSTHHSSNGGGHGRNKSHHHTSRKRHSHPPQINKHPHPIQRPVGNARMSLPAGPGVIHLTPANALHASSSHKQQGAKQPGSNLSSKAPAFEPVGKTRRLSAAGEGGSQGRRK
ncbi:hypothetical protein QCA50_013298 [Cerrena zonata]|uniref:Uncharacterized protein n=1 Tax=Cerrena zonata TaxID=2478898 RepID=A0AAW0FWJ1_9APHY